MITRVKASNVKGLSFDDALEPITLLTGANHTGKTARLDAIRIGLLGYHPRLPQTNQGTFKLAGGSPMLVDLWLDDDKIKREWHLDTRTGRVSYAGCDGSRVPPVLLDARQYLGMPAREKLWYVCERVDVTKHGYNDDALLKSIECISIEPNTTSENERKSVAGLVDQFRREIKERGKQNVTAWLREMVDKLISKRKELDAGLKAQEGLLNAQPQLGEGESPALSVEEATAGRDRLTRKLADLEGQLRDLKMNIDLAKENKRNREDVQADIDDITDRMITEVELDALKAQIKRRRPLVMGEENDQSEGLRARIEKQLSDNEKVDRTIDKIEQERETLKEKADGVLAGDKCPTCKSWKQSYTKWWKAEDKKLKDRRDSENHAHDINVKAIADLTLELEREEHRVEKVREHLASVEAVRRTEEAREKIAILRKSMPELVKRPDDKEWNALEKSITEARNELELFEREHRRAISAATDRTRLLQAQEKAKVLETSRNVHKLAIAAVEAEAKRVTDIVLAQVLARAREVTGGILPGDFQYADGEFGYYNGAAWVTHDTFSGSEEMIAFAALSYALASESPLKIILMDELGRLDLEHKRKLMKRMREMVDDGRLHQFCGIDVTLDGYEDAGKVKVIAL